MMTKSSSSSSRTMRMMRLMTNTRRTLSSSSLLPPRTTTMIRIREKMITTTTTRRRRATNRSTLSIRKATAAATTTSTTTSRTTTNSTTPRNNRMMMITNNNSSPTNSSSSSSRRSKIRMMTTSRTTTSSTSSSSNIINDDTIYNNNTNHKNKNDKKRLTLDTMSSSILNMEYAVRGQVVIVADEISKELQNIQQEEKQQKEEKQKESSSSSLRGIEGEQQQQQESTQITSGSSTSSNTAQNTTNTKYPFHKIIYTNIGNPQSVGQEPLTWPRQVLALVDLPNDVGIHHPNVRYLFTDDIIERASEMKLAMDGHSSGSYSHSKGVFTFRNEVCNFIQQRDTAAIATSTTITDNHNSNSTEELPPNTSGGGSMPYPNPEHIFLTNGASDAITMILRAIISNKSNSSSSSSSSSIIQNKKTGIMIPIPQYPIYSATIDLFDGHRVGYYMNEENAWSLDIDELNRAYDDAIKTSDTTSVDISAFVLINPGNPTGQVLSRQNIYEIIQFCVDRNLILLADEVYQENVYDPNIQFISCRRAAYEMGLLNDDGSSDQLELVSFHSISKGLYGECGRRGGYMELIGIESDVIDQLYKLASTSLCSTLSGQIMISLMCNGPQPNDISYTNHEQQKQIIFQSLQRRATLVSNGLNNIHGLTCQPAVGSMYCFPAITNMPQHIIDQAQHQNTTPDTLYALSLLRNTGICVVPASGFGQRIGRYGFRTTFLPCENDMEYVVQQIQKHHELFCKQQ